MKSFTKEINKDIVVVGGGIAGMCAAVAAARKGARVALVHNRLCLVEMPRVR